MNHRPSVGVRKLAHVCLLLVLVGLSACGGAPATSVAPGASGVSATAGASTPSTITFQFFGDAEELAVYQKVAQRYMETHPGRTVTLNNVPSQGDHMTKLAAGFSAGNPPDVFLVNYRRYGQFVKNGVLDPLGPRLAQTGLREDQFYPIALDAFRANGQLQCIPQNISSPVVYYNKDLFAARGVEIPKAGWTWNDMVLTAQQMTADTNADGVLDFYGLGVEPELIRLAPFIWQNAGELVDDPDQPTKLMFDNERTREAIDFFLSLRTVYSVVPTEAESRAEDNETAFRNGKLAMVINSRRAVPNFRTITGFEWDVVPLPQRDAQSQPATVLHSDAFCMSVASKNKDAAWDWIQFASGPEGQRMAAELGRTVPSLKEVAESPAFLEPSRAPANSKAFLDVIPSIRVLPIVSTWPALENAVNQELELAFYANDEAAEAGGRVENEQPGRQRPLEPAARQIIDTAIRKALIAANEELAKANQ